MPAEFSGRLFEDLRLVHTAGARAIDEGVVRLGEGQMHLRHEHVGVVARVADDRRAFDVAQHVGVVGAEAAASRGRRGETGRDGRPARRRRGIRGSVAVSARSSVRAGSTWCRMADRSAVMSCATNCPKNGQPAASVPSDDGSSCPSPQSQRPPVRPSAKRNASSAENTGRSGKRRPYDVEAIGASTGVRSRDGARQCVWSISGF